MFTTAMARAALGVSRQQPQLPPRATPSSRMKQWSLGENQQLVAAVMALGPRWKLVAARVPGRTENMCRNRIQRIQAGKKLFAKGVVKFNRCQWCGEPARGHICFSRPLPLSYLPVDVIHPPDEGNGIASRPPSELA